jgi:hypothetical protein
MRINVNKSPMKLVSVAVAFGEETQFQEPVVKRFFVSLCAYSKDSTTDF